MVILILRTMYKLHNRFPHCPLLRSLPRPEKLSRRITCKLLFSAHMANGIRLPSTIYRTSIVVVE